jgi:hypothetical protein
VLWKAHILAHSKPHAIIASSSSSINTHGGPIFLLLVFPYRWSKNGVLSMPQNLLSLHKKIMPLSIASMATFNNSFDHLPLGFVTCTLFVCVNLYIVFNIV